MSVTPFVNLLLRNATLLAVCVAAFATAETVCGQQVEDTVLIDVGPGWKYFKGTQEPSPNPGGEPTTAWTEPGFDDSTWLNGATSIGYGDGDDTTVLDDMRNNYLTVYLRRTFSLADLGVSDVSEDIDNLIFSVDYDDGFVAYLNGHEIARSQNLDGKGNPPAHDDDTDGTHEVNEGTEQFNLNGFVGFLTPTNNVLAIQSHNGTLGSSDLSIHPRLLNRTVLPDSVVVGSCTVGSTVSPSEGNIRSAWSDLGLDPATAMDVMIDGGTGPVTISGMNNGVSCGDGTDSPTMWSFSVGDDVDTVLDGAYSSQNFGGFSDSNGIGDWSEKSNYCVKVENPNAHEIFVQLLVLTSLGRDGFQRLIRQLFTSEGVWIPARTEDAGDGFAVVCLNLDAAFDINGNPASVTNREFVTGLGMTVGAFPADCDAFCRLCEECATCEGDDCPGNCPDADSNPKVEDCPGRECVPASRESDSVSILVSQAAPEIEIDTDPGADGIQSDDPLDFQGGETREIEISNTGLGPLTLSLDIVGADKDLFSVTGSGVVSPGETVLVKVTYSPVGVGTNTATLQINSDDPDECQNTIGLTGITTTNLRFSISGVRKEFDACVELVVVSPPTALLSIGVRVGYNPAEIEFVRVEKGADLIISPGVPDDPATENVDESQPEVAWEIVHADNDSDNGVIEIVATDLEGAAIDIVDPDGQVVELFCLKLKFINPPPCSDSISTVLFFSSAGTPDPVSFPSFDQYLTSAGGQTLVETEITSLVAKKAEFAANQFVRGDIDFNLVVDPQDALLAVAILFDQAFSLDRDCPAVLDVNNDANLNILDAITVIQTAFGMEPLSVHPAPPFPDPGMAITSGDNKNSELPCNEGAGCEL